MPYDALRDVDTSQSKLGRYWYERGGCSTAFIDCSVERGYRVGTICAGA
jgi:hypothetical protein